MDLLDEAEEMIKRQNSSVNLKLLEVVMGVMSGMRNLLMN
jgi:hypothetical protein